MKKHLVDEFQYHLYSSLNGVWKNLKFIFIYVFKENLVNKKRIQRPIKPSEKFLLIQSPIICRTLWWRWLNFKSNFYISPIFVNLTKKLSEIKFAIKSFQPFKKMSKLCTKGQLISKWNFGVFKSSKKWTYVLTDFCPSLHKMG